jgi:hypothetical protein
MSETVGRNHVAADSHPFPLHYAPSDTLPAGSVAHFALAALVSAVATVALVVLAAASGAARASYSEEFSEDIAFIGCLGAVFAMLVAGAGIFLAMVTVALRHLVLEHAAQMRGRRSCIVAGIFYPVATVGIAKLASVAGILPRESGVLLCLPGILFGVAAGWWMVRKKSPE